LLLILTSAIYFGTPLWIKKIGITIKSSRVYEPLEVRYFLQNEPEWKDDLMGASDYHLGESGCLVCVLATVLNRLGFETNPKELNKIFSKTGVYNRNGEIIWYKINDAIPGVTYRYKKVFGRNTIENDLRHGRLPIIRVRYYRKGVFHWVGVVGSDEEEFFVVDPLNQGRNLVRLGLHGRVYAYRVLIK
jgi:hypothetical protein